MGTGSYATNGRKQGLPAAQLFLVHEYGKPVVDLPPIRNIFYSIEKLGLAVWTELNGTKKEAPSPPAGEEGAYP